MPAVGDCQEFSVSLALALFCQNKRQRLAQMLNLILLLRFHPFANAAQFHKAQRGHRAHYRSKRDHDNHIQDQPPFPTIPLLQALKADKFYEQPVLVLARGQTYPRNAVPPRLLGSRNRSLDGVRVSAFAARIHCRGHVAVSHAASH